MLNRSFLIDTGATLSLVPHKLVQNICSTGDLPYLVIANGTKITTFGQKELTVNLGFTKPITRTFVVTAIDTAIIGPDFLIAHGLLVDMKNRR